ncbi:MAG: hypothetical protein M3063_11650 [Actinomycetota bacterium]|nr:hypothetical protein [Actinomycetota bacterium]
MRLNALLFHRPTGLPRVLMPLAAVLLLADGWVHLDLYRHGYSSIPTIGPLFAANAASSAVVGVVVLFRRELMVRAALSVAVATLAGFAASRLPGGIFGFQEQGLQPAPQGAEALIAEIAIIVVLAGSFAWDKGLFRRGRSTPARAAATAPGHVQVERQP